MVETMQATGNKVAKLFDVSANTVSAWTQKGMPVEAVGTRGKPSRYNLPDVFLWNLAHGIVVKRRKKVLDTLPMMLLGDTIVAADDGVRGYARWRPRGVALAERLGFSEGEFHAAIGELIEGELIALAWQR